ncbi:YciK family oxidoreductase [Aurantivibrio plasticivorans]
MTSPNLQDYQPPTDLLAGKVIAVTGAGDGIGRVAALTCAKHGATVILLGRTIQKLEKVYDEIESLGCPQAAIYPINFEGAVEKDYDDMAVALDKEFGKLDGLLHNAAILGPRTPLTHFNAESWQSVMQVNATAPFLMTKALSPLLEKAPHASIIFTGSSVGYEGRAFWGAYAASKAAIENMMQTLSSELSDTTNIRVNSINPGATRTKMRALAYPGENPNTLKTPEDIMSSYLFLLGDDSMEISGKQIQAQPKDGQPSIR